MTELIVLQPDYCWLDQYLCTWCCTSSCEDLPKIMSLSSVSFGSILWPSSRLFLG